MFLRGLESVTSDFAHLGGDASRGLLFDLGGAAAFLLRCEGTLFACLLHYTYINLYTNVCSLFFRR